jgi:RHS repeat-associated protein
VPEWSQIDIEVTQTKSMNAQGASLAPDFAFTGHYYHARSGLYLAPYRAYNPALGRWLSRDPIGEAGGTNLYQYVNNNPLNKIDQLGLTGEPAWTKLLATAGHILGAGGDFWSAYNDMRDANTIGADKYFHCLANCRAATRGRTIPIVISLAREASDTVSHLKHPLESLRDSLDDMKANRRGWSCPLDESCEQRCAKYRPSGLPPQY